MAEKITAQQRSYIMSRIRAKNTKFETDFIKILSPIVYAKGYRYRKHYTRLLGKPDLVFIKYKLAIFLDSDFWHGYRFNELKKRLKSEFWIQKIERNKRRDKTVTRLLRRRGWYVIRIWEYQIRKDPMVQIQRILGSLE